jgi:hypothetical protein
MADYKRQPAIINKLTRETSMKVIPTKDTLFQVPPKAPASNVVRDKLSTMESASTCRKSGRTVTI